MSKYETKDVKFWNNLLNAETKYDKLDKKL